MSPREGLEYISCNLCGEDDANNLAVQCGYRIVGCRVCGLVYVNPRPFPEDLPALYAEYHGRGGEDGASWRRLMAEVFREAAVLLCASRNGTGPGRSLDAGCGFGGFVAEMRRLGWDAEGVDPSASVVAAARAEGLPVRLGTIEEAERPDAPYDAVTMFYVLEHLPDPMAALRKVFALLSPGGTLLLRVPDTTPIVRMLRPFGLDGTLYDPPFHLFDFSPAVLSRMLRESGFVRVRTFPGRPTVPSRFWPRAAARAFGAAARSLHSTSRGAILLPGVSKTTIAERPR